MVSSYGYGYTPNGNRLSQIETNGGLTETTGYTYDELNRLETIAYPGNRNVAYEYDRVGNRRFETERDGAGTVVARKEGVFDAANRLGQLTDHVDATKSATLGWDENGNQIWKTIGSGDGAVTTRNLYDARDKLIEVQQGDSTLSRFQFDFDGRRTEKIGLETRQYVYDQTSILGELNETGTEIAKYDYGSDRLISLTHLSEGRRFYSFDALGSVTNLTDDTGSGGRELPHGRLGQLPVPGGAHELGQPLRLHRLPVGPGDRPLQRQGSLLRSDPRPLHHAGQLPGRCR